MTDRIQVILGPMAQSPSIAGVPGVLRTAQRITEDLEPERLSLLGAGTGFAQRWSRQLAGLDAAHVDCLGAIPPGKWLTPGVPLLAVSADGIPANGALAAFLRSARAADRPARWLRRDEVLAAYYPSPDSYAAGLPHDARVFEAGDNDWIGFSEPDAAARTEQALVEGLIKDTDGYIARWDRRISMALSLFLLKTPVTPNHVTTASLFLGILGAVWLAFGSYIFQVLGALLLWFCCILDGCDGEVARLKLLSSRSGASYDLGADHIAHLAIFVAVPFAVHTANPQVPVLLPGALMVSGLAACMFTIWWLILRRPQKHPGPVRLFFERVASRDYVYVILALTVIRKLHWFLWAAAFGAHLFNLALWWVFLRHPHSAQPAQDS